MQLTWFFKRIPLSISIISWKIKTLITYNRCNLKEQILNSVQHQSEIYNTLLFDIILTNFITLQIQKQSHIGVLQKLYSNFTEITLLRGCFPVHLLHICRTAVLTNAYEGLLLQIFIQHVCLIFQYKFFSFLPYI